MTTPSDHTFASASSTKARGALYAVIMLCATGAVVLVVARHARPERTEKPSQLWSVPAFSFTDHMAREVSLNSLHGTPFIASFFFTRCPTSCPLLTSKLVQFQQRTQGRRLVFVSFSLDPEHDTAEVLRSFAEAWNATETRWHLLPTQRDSLDAALVGFRVSARRTSKPDNPIIHSSAFFLVDAEGFVRGVYESGSSEALEQLTRDTLVLTHPGEAP